MNIDETYFNEVDTEEKAWLLGLLSADGYITDHGRGFGISQSGDEGKELVEYIRKILKVNNPVRGQKTTHKISYGIRANNKKFVENLGRFGILQRKSYNFAFPSELPNQYLKSFIRGYVDGDGCVTVSKNKAGCLYLSVSFCGTKDFIDQCLKKKIPQWSQVLTLHNKITKEIRWYGKRAETFCEWLYSDKLFEFFKVKNYQDYLIFRKNVPNKNHKYTPLRIKALKLIKNGENPMEIAKTMNLPFQTIYKWKSNANRTK